MAMTILKLTKPRNVFGRFLIRHISSRNLTERDVEEIQIPVPWGHISGKWWGDKKEPPVVAIHGWQDNANSFDKLIPLLNLTSVLAIDLPGQGMSSHFPDGVIYDFSDLLMALHRIKTYFGWPNVPLLTHSLGAAIGYVYAAVFPTEVKWLISTECIRCALSLRKYDCYNLCEAIDKFLRIEEYKRKQLNPSYKLSQLISMYMEGNIGSVCQPEKALTILNRVLLPSQSVNAPKGSGAGDLEIFFGVEGALTKTIPTEEEKDMEKHLESLKESLNRARENLKNFSLDESDDKYYTLKQDPSFNILMVHVFDEEFLLKTAERIKCPVLSIRAKDGFLHGATKKLYERNLDILKTSSPYVEHHNIDGTHHVHLWKWWGSRDKQPILCLHGWQDNANTFDALIPRLPSEFSYLAIDMPGHGLSSHIPKGIFYKLFTYDPLTMIRRIRQNFKWKKLSFIAHSLGAATASLYSSVFSSDVNFIVAIDSIKPQHLNVHKEIHTGSRTIEKLLKYDSQDISTATGYKEDELIKLWLESTDNSLTEESCKILLRRGAVEKDGLLTLRRDSKLKEIVFSRFPKKKTFEIVENISCGILYIKASDWPYFENEQDVIEAVQIIKRKAKYFEQHILTGRHHLHLNNPEPVALVISAFLKSAPVE